MSKFKGVMHKLGCSITDDEAKEVGGTEHVETVPGGG